MEPILTVEKLSVEYHRKKEIIPAVDDVSFELFKAESIGIVGESGCGKSSLVQSLIKLIPANEGRVTKGKVIFNDLNLLKLQKEQLNDIRGKKIAYVPQDPFSSLNPVMRIDSQISEMFPKTLTQMELRESSVELLKKVHMNHPENVLRSYPHQLSGGMRQRVLIAMAIASNPEILIADEPTTALDVTIQKEILDLITELVSSLHMALILVTHNLGIVNERTHRVFVMYAGRLVEEIRTDKLFSKPKHPYTKALIKAVPVMFEHKMPECIEGSMPHPQDYPKGCRFAPRCHAAFAPCTRKEPKFTEKDHGKVACFLYE